ncbi:MAG TPA: NAD(P)/FAD-dependent oxidoreductase [Clostridiales bacterium]|nr:NAD(P)/FAD-dependent oxidoreductase [Clostridiales bacterium]
MKNTNERFVIIGNGIGGLAAAEEIRKNNETASITVISQEDYLTYYRMKLSHSISKEATIKELLVHGEDWYDARSIQVLLGKRAERIDTENKCVVLEDGKQIPYDKLLIANGSTPFMPSLPGIEKQGVYSLRTFKDLTDIQNYLRDCREVAVVGGGLLGLEAAWALKERGLKVHILQRTGYLLEKQLDEELADYVREWLEREGLIVDLFVDVQEIGGEQKVREIYTKDGRTIPADMVLFSVGVRPNIEIAEGTPLKVNRGILVNQRMETSVDDIYAAGDIAELENAASGLWTISMAQGKVAGQNMAGAEIDYVPAQPATVLSIGDFSLFSVGKVGNGLEKISYKNKDVFHKLFVKDGNLVGGVLIGDTKKMAKLKKAVEDRVSIKEMAEKGRDALEIIQQL